MYQIFQVLNYLHSKKFIYRDLKPENIMISDDGFVKLIDLGLGVQINEENQQFDDLCGTSEYIPPEVLTRHKYSYNFDWWGFGILMYELLMGKVYKRFYFNIFFY